MLSITLITFHSDCCLCDCCSVHKVEERVTELRPNTVQQTLTQSFKLIFATRTCRNRITDQSIFPFKVSFTYKETILLGN